MSLEKEEASAPRRRLSCTTHFDDFWFCYSPVHQMQQYYRLGDLDNCSGKWTALVDCLSLKTKRSSEVELVIGGLVEKVLEKSKDGQKVIMCRYWAPRHHLEHQEKFRASTRCLSAIPTAPKRCHRCSLPASVTLIPLGISGLLEKALEKSKHGLKVIWGIDWAPGHHSEHQEKFGAETRCRAPYLQHLSITSPLAARELGARVSDTALASFEVATRALGVIQPRPVSRFDEF